MRHLRPATAVGAVVALAAGLTGVAAAAARTPAPVLAPLAGTGAAPTAGSVAAALAGPLTAAAFGGDLVGEVLDVRSGAVLWSRAAQTPVLVASTQKLLVSAASLDVLGAAHTEVTALRSTGSVAAGVLSGDLDLQGGGDVLLAATSSSGWPAVAGLDQLAAALRATGVRRVQGSVVGDGSYFTGASTAPGWKPTYVTEGSVAPVSGLEVDRGEMTGVQARSEDPTLQAAGDLVAALARHGIAVTGTARTGVTPAAARTLASAVGPTLDVGVQEMLQDSDNDAAESYGRQLALATRGQPTFAGASAAIAAQLHQDGLPTGGLSLADASGLSRDDRVPPALLAAVLRDAATTKPAWRPILEGLPVAAFSGTLADRDLGAAGTAAAGVVRAKTGNIAGVTAVAGTVVDRSGRQLVFVFVTNDAQGLNPSEAALDSLAAALVPL
jgi:D-alanyl-D-alanine carboxypeptidase/D-alanyl-D-alanine-endopeptidase (penicillin-binding protein 4)